jgi:hypothetical protein
METVNDPASMGVERLVPSFRILLILYIALFAASVLILGVFDVRPIIYYVAVTAIALVILLELLFYKASHGAAATILLQIMLLTLSVIWSMSLKYYYFIGRTDVLGHTWYAETLASTGHIAPELGYYVAFAMWHILNSLLYTITGLHVEMHTVLFVTCGLIFMLIPVGVYVLLMKLYSNSNMALMAALISSFTPAILLYGSYSIARSIVTFLFLAILILLMSRKGMSKVALLLFFTLMIVMYHTVSIVFLIVILAAMYVVQILFVRGKENKVVPGLYLLACVAIVSAYWALNSSEMIEAVQSNLLSAAPEGVITKSVVETPLSELANYLQHAPYIFLIIVGGLLALRSKHFSDRMKLFGLSALLFIAITFPGPALLMNKLAGNFQLDRFESYTMIFMIVAAAVGLSVLYLRAGKAAKAFLIVLFGLWVLLSVSNDFVSSDNPLVMRPYYTNYLTENEVTSFDHIVELHLSRIMADHVTQRYYQFSPYHQGNYPLNVDGANNTIMQPKPSDLILIRDGELEKRPLKLCTAVAGKYDRSAHKGEYDFYYKGDPAYDDLGRFDRVYDSAEVRAYL